nr:putative WAPL (Wings apart-like protein regulation of heterochromatin) protein [Tanacetum cinerariifolium]
MIVRTYGRRSNSNSRSSNSTTNSLNFSDTEESLSQDLNLNLNKDFQNFAFNSQESVKNTQFDSFESDPFSFDEDTSRSKRPKIEFGDKKGKKVVSLIETTTLMETQEEGEMMEHVDEVNFGLDGLRRGQPVRVRRSSLLSLLNVCGTLQQRRLLRTHGTARTIIDAVLGLSLDDTPSNLAAAALFFVLTSDGQDDFLLDSPIAIRFLLKLLKPATKRATKKKVTTLGSKLVALSKDVSIFNDGKGDESLSAALLQKVEEVLVSCKELKPRSESDSETKRPELTPKWIALLTMEKACLSTVSLEESTGTVRKMGGNFKEKLREHGGLDAVIEIIRECHGVMEGWLERYSSPTSQNIVDFESPILLLKCLKIMENATFLSNDNQSHLLREEDDSYYRNVSQSFTKLILNVIKILSGVSLMKSSESNSDIRNGNSLSNGTAHISDLQSQADDNVDNNELIYISSSIENCISDLMSSQKSSSTSQKNELLGSSKADPISGFNNQLLKITAKSSTSRSTSGTLSSLKNGSKHGKKLGKKSETSQRTRRAAIDFEDSQDPFGSQDPFAFDDDEGEQVSKWDLLSGKKNLSQSQKSSSVLEEDEHGSKDIVLLSQQESCNMERRDSPPQASCSHVVDDAKLNLLADCLLASVKVLMNLTNDNPVGCRQIAACGGLETLCGLIAGHFPSFSLYLPNFSDQGDKSIVLEGNNKRLNDQELDFLVAILGLLVNLVEKDGRNRSRLAAASISIPSSSGSDYEITDVIPLLCSIFMANQGAGEAAEEGRQAVWNNEDPILEGEKEAEKTIVEAYSALLLAFISTESKSIRNAVAECLPKRKLSILVPVLERFVEFHMSLNMISEETHSMVLEVRT